MTEKSYIDEKCEWCDSSEVRVDTSSVYWELPEGTRAIEITHTPTMFCESCQMIYQNEKMVKIIEDQLFLIDRSKLGEAVSYDSLMALPKILKRNYFDF